ncbi:MAG TPA: hypothetical protein VFZ65_09715 [Planctomycetota bacterium]|nr:hypothetical protein [Planctomycetota bacterium]
MATGAFAPSFAACAFAACAAWLLPTAAPAQVRAVPAPLLQLELRAPPHGELTRDFPGVAPTIGNDRDHRPRADDGPGFAA